MITLVLKMEKNLQEKILYVHFVIHLDLNVGYPFNEFVQYRSNLWIDSKHQ